MPEPEHSLNSLSERAAEMNEEILETKEYLEAIQREESNDKTHDDIKAEQVE